LGKTPQWGSVGGAEGGKKPINGGKRCSSPGLGLNFTSSKKKFHNEKQVQRKT